MSICFPKRDELLLRVVFALPMGSISGLVAITRSATLAAAEDVALSCVTTPRCAMHSFIASVLPAPDSPEMRTDWLRMFSCIRLNDLPISAYTCGGSLDGVYSGSLLPSAAYRFMMGGPLLPVSARARGDGRRAASDKRARPRRRVANGAGGAHCRRG